MTAPTTLVWELAGRPPVSASQAKLLKPIPSRCCVSGDWCEYTAPAGKALGHNFTDRTMFRAPESDRVGAPAMWAASGRGMATLRLWTVIAAPSVPMSHEKAFIKRPGLWLGNRSDTRPVIDVLASPPDGEWLVSVAVSGQKHVLPYATVNHGTGRWRVRMENTDITSTPSEWRAVHAAALALRQLGVRADDIHAGRPGLLKTREQVDEWRRIAPRLDPYTGSPLLELALWTITKPIIERNHP